MSPQPKQLVLTIPNESVETLYRRPAFHADEPSIRLVADSIAQSGRYTDRALAEEDRNLKQVVACTLVRCGNRLLCLRRSKRSNRASLRMKFTLLIGGHVDQQDALVPSPLDHCVAREVAEELGVLLKPGQAKPFGVVTDPTLSSSGWIHLGVVFLVEIESSSVSLGPLHDTSEFVYAGRSRVVQMLEVSEVISRMGRLDPWSSLVASSDAFRQSFQVDVPHVQTYLRFA